MFGLILTFYQAAPSDDQLYISRSAVEWTGDTVELQSVIYCTNGIAKLCAGALTTYIRSVVDDKISYTEAGLQPPPSPPPPPPHLTLPALTNQSQGRKTFWNSC